jgi:predicted RNA polymerase sigma factor
VLLEQQDRSRWDRAAIIRGRAALAMAVAEGRGLGAYGLQASIAECHAVAPSVEATDWDRIVVLYEALGRLTPSPAVELARAVAVAMASGPAAGLSIVDDVAARHALPGSHLVPAVRAEMLARMGRWAEARLDYLRAAELCANAAEREVLLEKARAIDLAE